MQTILLLIRNKTTNKFQFKKRTQKKMNIISRLASYFKPVMCRIDESSFNLYKNKGKEQIVRILIQELPKKSLVALQLKYKKLDYTLFLPTLKHQ